MSEAIALPPKLTVAAFDAFLAAQRDDGRWELIDGAFVGMADPSIVHEDIVGNIAAALRPLMPDDRECRISAGGLRVQVSADLRGTYAPRPDVMVWCGPTDVTRNFVTTPLIIIEVLSPSNMDGDRGAKLRFYTTGLPTLRHVALVYQDQCRVECYSRSDIGWDLVTLTRLDDCMGFAALLLEMPLSDVYGGVSLASG